MFSSCLTLQGGNGHLAASIPSAGLTTNLENLRLLEQPHLIPDDVAAILTAYRPLVAVLKRLEVRACRHVLPRFGPVLQEVAIGHRSEGQAGGGIAVHVIVDNWSLQ